jgi:hypothetical protein
MVQTKSDRNQLEKQNDEISFQVLTIYILENRCENTATIFFLISFVLTYRQLVTVNKHTDANCTQILGKICRLTYVGYLEKPRPFLTAIKTKRTINSKFFSFCFCPTLSRYWRNSEICSMFFFKILSTYFLT